MAFLVAGKPAFTIPLTHVMNTSITKAEVALEFEPQIPTKGPNDEDPVARKRRLRTLPDQVSEIRLYIPGSARGMKKKSDKAKIKAQNGAAGSDQEDSDDDDDESETEEGETAAQVFHDTVKEKADLGQITGESFCTVSEVLCLTPRGRFG